MPWARTSASNRPATSWPRVTSTSGRRWRSIISAASSAPRTASEYARTSPPAPRRVPPNQRVTTATTSLTPAPRSTSSMGAPAVPADSPSSEERWISWSGPSTNAEQWWRASQYAARAAAMTSRAASSERTGVSSPRNRERLISSSELAGPAMVRYISIPPLWQRPPHISAYPPRRGRAKMQGGEEGGEEKREDSFGVHRRGRGRLRAGDPGGPGAVRGAGGPGRGDLASPQGPTGGARCAGSRPGGRRPPPAPSCRPGRPGRAGGGGAGTAALARPEALAAKRGEGGDLPEHVRAGGKLLEQVGPVHHE